MRVGVVAVVFGVAAAAVIVRAAQIQIRDHEDYLQASERQAAGDHRVRAGRGPVLDRHGAELALSVQVDSIFAEPRRVREASRSARRLSAVLDRPAAQLERKLSADRSFVYLARRVDPEVGARVRSLGLAGIGTHQEARRFYPNRGLAAHVLGFTNVDEDGRAGVERTYDDSLRGGTIPISALRDALGNRVMTEGFVPPSSLKGEGLRLTIDRRIQYVAEAVLAETIDDFGAKAGAAVVLEVGTGHVLALASHPTFNPNNLTGSVPDHHLNRVISAVYEPGSTMKMVTIAAALEEGLVTPGSRIDCEGGKWRLGGRTIHDTHTDEGRLSIGDVLKVSSNVCAAKVGLRLGKRRMNRWLHRFGFADKTGIELPGELSGLIRPVSTWREIALANIAFGQGLAVTPLQLVQSAAVIAQDGLLVPPRIIASRIARDGTETAPDPPSARRVVSIRTARTLRRMLAQITGPEGTAPMAAVPGWTVAGKTGTAQKIDPVTKAYSHELYLASFVGMIPADRPKLVIAVFIDEPRGSIYGGPVAGPAFRRIAEAALTASGAYVGPEELPPESVVGAPVVDAPERDRAELQAPVAPSPDLDAALSAEARYVLGRTPEQPDSSLTNGIMPDLSGLELREVLKRCSKAKCRPRLIGRGRVVSQVPEPGVRIESGVAWRVSLAPRGGAP